MLRDTPFWRAIQPLSSSRLSMVATEAALTRSLSAISAFVGASLCSARWSMMASR